MLEFKFGKGVGTLFLLALIDYNLRLILLVLAVISGYENIVLLKRIAVIWEHIASLQWNLMGQETQVFR